MTWDLIWVFLLDLTLIYREWFGGWFEPSTHSCLSLRYVSYNLRTDFPTYSDTLEAWFQTLRDFGALRLYFGPVFFFKVTWVFVGDFGTLTDSSTSYLSLGTWHFTGDELLQIQDLTWSWLWNVLRIYFCTSEFLRFLETWNKPAITVF